ncbi:tape measure protein [Ruminococcaceae bacterium OttesenSCG-928-I18]|nr:tape measure protein [Ruminococcaceae bacterium OttesenSCG-928-I18]
MNLFSLFATIGLKDDGFTKGINEATGAGQKFDLSLGSIIKTVAGLKVVQVAFNEIRNAIGGAIERYDTLNRFPKVMEQMGFSTELAQKSIQRMSDSVQGLPTRLDDIVSVAQRIALTTGDLEGATDAAIALNNAFLGSGSTAADAARGLTQYTQMLSTGKVDIVSWRTLVETMGPALRMVGESFGFTEDATQQLYEALQSGDITFDEFNSRIIELNDGVGGFAEMAQEASGGIATAFTNLRTGIVIAITDVISKFDELLESNGFGGIEGVILKIRDGFKAFITAAGDTMIYVADTMMPLFKDLWALIQNDLVPIFTDAGGVIQSVLKPAFEGLVDAIRSIVQWFGDLDREQQKTILGLAAAALAMGPVIDAIIKLVSFVGSIKEVATGVGVFVKALVGVAPAAGASGAAGAVGALGAALAPLLPVIAAVAAAIATFVIGWKTNMGGFRDSIMETLPGLVEAWGTFKEGLSVLWDNLKEAVSTLKEAWDSDFAGIRTIVESVFSVIGEIIATAIEVFSGILEFIGSVFKGDWEGAWNAIKDIFTSVFEGIVEIFSTNIQLVIDLGNDLAAWLSEIWDGIKAKATETWNSIVEFMAELPGRIWDAISGAIERVTEWGSQILETARNKITSMITTVINLLVQLPGKIWNAIVSAIQRVAEWGQNIINTAREKITAMVEAVYSLASQIPSRIASAISGAIQAVVTWGSELVDRAKTAIRNMIDGIVNSASNVASEVKSIGTNIIQGIVNGINSMASSVVGAIKTVVDNAINAAKSALGIESPSKVFAEIGRYTAEGFVVGIESMANAVNDAVNDVFGVDTDILAPSLGGVSSLTPAMAGEASGMQPVHITQQFYQQYQSPIDEQNAAVAAVERVMW